MSHARRATERGLFRGCCLGMVILLVLLGLLAFTIDRAVAAPDLGPAPAGPGDGTTQQAIAVTLAAKLVSSLLTSPTSPHPGHASVTVSEQDLAVLAAAHNPHPDRFRNVQARVRNGLVAVSAVTSEGPFTVTVVGYFSMSLDRSSGPPRVVAHLVAVDVGALHIPGWLQDRFVGSYSPSVSFDQLFTNLSLANAALKTVQANLDCVAVVPNGVAIGVHLPTLQPDTSVCAPAGVG